MHLLRRVEDYEIDCDKRDVGAITLSMFKDRGATIQQEVDEINAAMGTQLEVCHDGVLCAPLFLLTFFFFFLLQVWPMEKVRSMYKTDIFYHGIFDPTAFTVQPLALVLGLAAAAEKEGARIFEHTKAVSLQKVGSADSAYRWKVCRSKKSIFLVFLSLHQEVFLLH